MSAGSTEHLPCRLPPFAPAPTGESPPPSWKQQPTSPAVCAAAPGDRCGGGRRKQEMPAALTLAPASRRGRSPAGLTAPLPGGLTSGTSNSEGAKGRAGEVPRRGMRLQFSWTN